MSEPRVAELEALFRSIAATRMAGLPMVHPALSVAAVGFQAHEGWLLGVLVTPWFMNLMRLPQVEPEAPLAVGATAHRSFGNERFPFIGAQEPGFGTWEACSLFSPMFEFVDQAAAVATAEAVLAELRKPPPVQASRRALLFGKGAPA